MGQRFCDQEDCPNFFYEEEKKPVEQTAVQVLSDPNYMTKLMKAWNTDADMVNGNFPSDPRDGMKILDVKIPVECFVCSYLKKCDMKTELKIVKARDALEGK